MKRILLFVFFSAAFPNAYAQYFDTSYVSASGDCHGATGTSSSNNDRYGNVYQCITTHICQSCADVYMIKKGTPQSWSYSFSYNTPASLKGYGDYLGNTYAFGSYSGSLRINGGYTSVSSDLNHFPLIKFDTTGHIAWALATVGTKISVTDSGYCYVAGTDSVAKYSPAGLMVWARQGGGKQIIATDDYRYFLIDSISVKKFDDSGNLLWQVLWLPGTSLNFERTYNNRLFLYNDTLISKLNPANGNVISSFVNYAGAINFFDKNANYYKTKDSILTKYDSSGTVWSTHLTGTTFANTGIDTCNNIYFANKYVTHVLDNYYSAYPVILFVPPTLYINPPGIDLTAGSCPSILIYIGRINQQYPANPVINTGEVKAVCKESVTDIPFTLNKYLVNYTEGMRAELSDSTGSFNNSLTIGTGIRSPITASTPFFNISGSGYRVRVVADDAGITGSESPVINQLAYPPLSGITLSNAYLWVPNSCSPLTLSVQPPGNYKCEWGKRPNDVIGYIPVSNNYNDSLTLTSAFETDYRVKITDTTTNCYSYSYRSNVTISSTTIHLDFIMPDTICISEGPLKIYNNFINGVLSGPGVYNDIFYPDSAGYGLHAINLHVNNTPSCYLTNDTTKFIYVDSCFYQIHTLDILPDKNSYCKGDTITIYFDYDSTLFDTSNVFQVQLGYYNYPDFYQTAIIGSGNSSPITCVLPTNISYNYMTDYRVRIVSTSPAYTGTVNAGGTLKIGQADGNYLLTLSDSATNCGHPNSIIKLNIYGIPGFQYAWHVDSLVFIDSLYPFSQSYFLATAPGNYSVEITTNYGCKAFSDTVHIGSSLSSPVATLSASSNTICYGDSVLIQLVTDSSNIVEWYFNSTVFVPPDTYSFYVFSSGSYTAEVVNASGCFISKTVNITSAYATGVSISTTGGITSFCQGDSLKLYVSANGNQYLWYKDGQPIFPPVTNTFIYVKDPGNYHVRCINMNGCISYSPVKSISVFPEPAVSVVPDSVKVCIGTNVVIPVNILGNSPFTLTVKKGTTTIYTNNNILNYTTQITINNPQTAYYYFIVQELNCSRRDTDSVYFTVLTPPVIQATPAGTHSFCRGDSLLLSVNSLTGFYYQWYKDNALLPGAVAPQFYAKQKGKHKAIVTDSICTVTSNEITLFTPCDVPVDNQQRLSDGFKSEYIIDIFPNPVFNQQLQIIFISPNNNFATFALHDISGRKVFSHLILSSSKPQLIRLPGLSNGIYQGVINSGKEIVVNKIAIMSQ